MSDFLIAVSAPNDGVDGLEGRVARLALALRCGGSGLIAGIHRSGRVLVVSLSTSSGNPTLEQCRDDLFRSTGVRLTLGTGCVLDMPRVAGRTMWRAQIGNADVVSTSMRAIVYLLGSLEPDPEATAWMLVTGSLGPERSWDRRCRQLVAGYRYTLGTDRKEPRPAPDRSFVGARRSDLAAEMEQRIERAVASFGFDPAEWALPLSGGVDSRAIAMAIGGRLPTFTYGDLGTLSDSGSDLAVARRVAKLLGCEHRELELGSSTIDPGSVLERFVAASEGRTDQLAGYADGMRLWIDLRAAGVRGVVRGDEVFGWVRRLDAPSSRVSTGAIVPGDLVLPAAVESSFLEIAEHQSTPAWFVRHAGEPLEDYRDRLYRGFRVPSILAPLTQTKSAYVNVACPFLADEVVELSLQVPGPLRTDKRLFRSSVVRRSEGIPFAQRASIRPSSSFIDSPHVHEVMRRRIESAGTLPGLPDPVRDLVLTPFEAGPAASRRNAALAAAVRRYLPLTVRREVAIRSTRGPIALGVDQLRLRAFVVAAGIAQLTDLADLGSMSDG